MSQTAEKKKQYANRILLYSMPVCSQAFYTAVKHPGSAGILLSHILLTVFAAGLYDIFLRLRQGYFYPKTGNQALYWGSYTVSFLLLGIQGVFPIGVLWLIFIVITALDSGMESAIANYVYLMIQYALIVLAENRDVYLFLLYLLIGLVIALLFSQLEDKKALPYLAVILAAGDLALQFAIYQFDFLKLKSALQSVILDVITLFLFVAIGYLYIYLKERRQKDIQLWLLSLMEPDQELLLKMEEYSMALLSHSMRVSQLSEGAAAAVGADTVLAKAGGLYHEIGKITGEKNYIEAGLRIGQEAGFPQRLSDILQQHSTAGPLPQSAEAAIVMLSDCILSTGDYLRKNNQDKKLPQKKLVQSVFQNRLEKGSLEESGLSGKQLGVLCEYYMNHAFTEMR